MDSPLNRAHQQERKAEQFILAKKYFEAIACYDKASAHITEAMKDTQAPQALVSLQLQYEDHQRKQRILKFKAKQQFKAENKTIELLQSQNEKTNGLSIESSLDSSGEIVDENVIISNEDNTTRASTNNIEDLQMQVLSMTQALEDCNRENNHLRNIIVKFKEVLQTRFGLSEEEIEEVLLDNTNNTDNYENDERRKNVQDVMEGIN